MLDSLTTSPSTTPFEGEPVAPAPPPDEKEILAALNDIWSQAVITYKNPRERSRNIVRMYNSDLPVNWGQVQVNGKMVQVGPQSRTHKSWTYQAVTTAVDHTMEALFPDDKPFQLSTYNPGSQGVLAVVEDVIQALCLAANVESHVERALHQAFLQGESGTVTNVRLDHNGIPTLDLVGINTADVFTYPATEPPERCILGARFFMTRFELMSRAEELQLFNLDKLPLTKQTYTSPSTNVGNTQTVDSTTYRRLGVEVRTYWCPELNTGTSLYRNVEATVLAEGGQAKTLIGFRDIGSIPFNARPYQHYVHNPVSIPGYGLSNIGRSLVDAGYNIELEAITKANILLDTQKLATNPPRKWHTHATGHTRQQLAALYPGQFITIGDAPDWHLDPLQIDTKPAMQIVAEIQSLKTDYEQAVGIPNFLTGAQGQDDKRVSATAKRMQAAGSDIRLKRMCKRINSHMLRPMFACIYRQVVDGLNAEIAEFNLEPYAQDGAPNLGPWLHYAKAVSPNFSAMVIPDGTNRLMPAPPVENVTIILKAYESELDKVDRLNQAQSGLELIGMIANMAPMLLPMFDVPKLLETIFRCMGLGYALVPLALQQPIEENPNEQGDGSGEPAVAGASPNTQPGGAPGESGPD